MNGELRPMSTVWVHGYEWRALLRSNRDEQTMSFMKRINHFEYGLKR